MLFENEYNAIAEILFPGTSKFLASDVPDLSGKVVFITGGNTGIGKETARILLEHNAKVFIGCRSLEKGTEAVNDLIERTGKSSSDVRLIQMDLANLPSIKAGVEEFLKTESRLDQLYNSAGVMWCPESYLTTHGHDMQFGTNVLGHFYLTQLLLPTLLSTAAASSSPGQVRIVNLSSNAHWGALTKAKGGPIVYESLVDGPERKKYDTSMLYYQSKAGNVILSNALARKYGDKGIASIALNPGAINTDLARHTSPITHFFLRMLFYPVSQGVLSPLYAGTSPDAASLNGKYLVPWARVRPSRRDLEDVETQEKMWEWCEAEIKKYAP